MGITDPIADMATLIRNATRVGREKVDVKASKLNEEILKILMNESFIKNYKKIEDKKQGILRVYLKYNEDADASKIRNMSRKSIPAITNIKRVSKPGLRIYRGKKAVKPVLSGLGIAILTTSQGIVTDVEAREKNIGGEIILEVW